MEEVGVEESDKSVENSNLKQSKTPDNDESGFGDDISACSIEDKTFSDKMDTSEETGNHFALEQCSAYAKMVEGVELSQGDNNFILSGLKKDDSGIYSEKSPSNTQNKEISDGEWSESVSESLEDTNVDMKDGKVKFDIDKPDEISEYTGGRKVKITDGDSCVEGMNGKSDEIEVEEMEDEIVDSMKCVGNEKGAVSAINNKEKQDIKVNCDKLDTLKVTNETDESESKSSGQQIDSDKCDNNEMSNDDEDFAEFVKKTVKSRSHVRKLVDYDSDDSDKESGSDSHIVVKGSRRYRKRKPETDSDDDNANTNDSKGKGNGSSEQNDGTPVLLRHSVLNDDHEQNNVDISDLSTDSSDESLHSPRTKHESSSEDEANDTPPLTEFGPPKQKWKALFDIRNREFGNSIRKDPGYFRKQVQGSLQMVKRFELQFKMDQHEGCVNALHFNRIGRFLLPL